MKADSEWGPVQYRTGRAEVGCSAYVCTPSLPNPSAVNIRLDKDWGDQTLYIRMSIEEAENLMVDLARVLQSSKPDTSDDCVGCNGGTKRPIQVAYTQTGEEYCYHCGRDCRDR